MRRKAIRILLGSLGILVGLFAVTYGLFFRFPEILFTYQVETPFITFYANEPLPERALQTLASDIRSRLDSCGICAGEGAHVVLFADRSSLLGRIHARIYKSQTYNLGQHPVNRIFTFRSPDFGRDLLLGERSVPLTHTLAHELAHSYQQRLLGEQARDIAFWKREGHADFAGSGERWADPPDLRREVLAVEPELVFLRAGLGYRNMRYADARRASLSDGAGRWPTAYRWSGLLWSYLIRIRGMTESEVFGLGTPDSVLTQEAIAWARTGPKD